MGAIIRAAGCFDATSIYYTGTRYDRAKPFHTDTHQAANQNILQHHVDDLIQAAPDDCTIVCVDLIEGACSLAEFEHPDKALYIFGPEDGSIKQDIIDQADTAVFIASKACLNLAASVNIVLYDRSSKINNMIADDDLIRASRDINNRSKLLVK